MVTPKSPVTSSKSSPYNINTKENWEKYFNISWEKNNGREQTRLFAEYFLANISLPKDVKSLLDVGCAFGDALQVFRKNYPYLDLFGCDISELAISESRKKYQQIASFLVWDFFSIEGFYDAIYISNVLEHFENYIEIATNLLNHCHYLYIMVPYKEFRNGKVLEADPNYWHVTTFFRDSFNPLYRYARINSIKKKIIYTPKAWGDEPWPFFNKFKYFIRHLSFPKLNCQIIYCISRSE